MLMAADSSRTNSEESKRGFGAPQEISKIWAFQKSRL
jgi:hypothetical protein